VLFRGFCSAVGYFGRFSRILFLPKYTPLYKPPRGSTALLTKTSLGLPRFSSLRGAVHFTVFLLLWHRCRCPQTCGASCINLALQ
jgi:hypothetical protein